VTRGLVLPQTAGSPSLNSSGTGLPLQYPQTATFSFLLRHRPFLVSITFKFINLSLADSLTHSVTQSSESEVKWSWTHKLWSV